MALYRHTATGFLGEFASNPGAGYTAISAMPTDTVANRVAWWRGLDTFGQTSSWHPSEYRSAQDPSEATISIQFTQEAALISADPDGTVTNSRDPGDTYYLGAATEVRVYRGITDVTVSEGWTLTKVEEGCTSTLTQTGGLYTLKITDIPLVATQSGFVRVTASRVGSGDFVKDFRFLKVFQGQDGFSGLVMDLDNENQTVAALKDGTWIAGTTATTTARLYLGATPLSSGITWSVLSATSGITYSQTSNTSSFTVTVTNMTAALVTGSITLRAVYNGVNYDQVFTISKANAGSDGTPATVFWLDTSASAIAKDKTGTYNPSSITLNAYSQTGTGAVLAYTGRFRVETQATLNGAWTARYNSLGNEASASYTIPASIVAVRVILFQAGGTTTILDQETVPVVADGQDGSSAYAMILSNESHTIPAAGNGTPTSYTGAACTATVYLGTSPDTGWAFAGSPASSSSLAYTTSGSTFTVTGMAAATDSAFIDITASKAGQTSLVRRFSISKSRAGKSLSIQATAQAIANGSPPSVQLTAVGVGITAATSTQQWYFKTGYGTQTANDVAWAGPYGGPQPPLDTRLNSTGYSMPGNAAWMIWKCEWDGLEDQITLVRVSDGPSGVRGSRQIVISGTSDWNDTTAWDGLVTRFGGTPVLSDLVTIVNTSLGTSTSKFLSANAFRPGTWETPTAYINGNLLVTGTVGADKIAAGTIGAHTISLSGSSSIIRSSNYIAGSAGWQIRGDGVAEFRNVTIRGSLNASDMTGGTLSVDRISANSISGGKITIGGIDTGNLGVGVVTKSYQGSNTVSGTVIANQAIQVFSQPITSNYGQLGDVILMLNVSAVSPNLPQEVLRLDCQIVSNDGFSQTVTGRATPVPAGSPSLYAVVPMNYVHKANGSTSRTYTYYIYFSGNATNSSITRHFSCAAILLQR
jgi:hypothetical protein